MIIKREWVIENGKKRKSDSRKQDSRFEKSSKFFSANSRERTI